MAKEFEPSYSADELDFIAAVEEFKKANGVRFPTFTQLLDVAVALGYRKVSEPGPLPVVERGGRRPAPKAFQSRYTRGI